VSFDAFDCTDYRYYSCFGDAIPPLSNLSKLCLLTTTAACCLLSSSSTVLFFGYRAALLEKRQSILSSSHCRPSRTAARYFYFAIRSIIIEILRSAAKKLIIDTIYQATVAQQESLLLIFTSSYKVLLSGIAQLSSKIENRYYLPSHCCPPRTASPYFTFSYEVLLFRYCTALPKKTELILSPPLPSPTKEPSLSIILFLTKYYYSGIAQLYPKRRIRYYPPHSQAQQKNNRRSY
jgi:hypothetical protein